MSIGETLSFDKKFIIISDLLKIRDESNLILIPLYGNGKNQTGKDSITVYWSYVASGLNCLNL